MAETARVLMAADLIEEAVAPDVIHTLTAADLINQEALAEATAAVEQANVEWRRSGKPRPRPTVHWRRRRRPPGRRLTRAVMTSESLSAGD